MKKSNKLPTSLKSKRCVAPKALFIVFVSAFLMMTCTNTATAINISSDPMETKVISAPPNIMFILDDSGSMDWEFMTNEGSGVFEGYEYIFDMDDNAYTDSLGDVLDSNKRKKWKSQWHGYNKLFYNPNVDYQPWPGKSDASLSTPLSNPHAGTDTITLNNTFMTLTMYSDSLIVVDNTSDGGAYTEVGTGWSNSSPGTMFGGSARYTGTTGNKAIWAPEIPTAGSYTVYVWWNNYNQRDEYAKYVVSPDGGTEDIIYKNQNSSTNGGIHSQWVEIGTYSFPSGTGSTISVERHNDTENPSTGSSTVADAVLLVPEGGGTTLSEVSVDISNAHYFLLDDTDGDGEKDDGEYVYLVDFDINTATTPATVDRNYYRVNISNGYVDGKIIEMASLPESIQPKVYNDDGTAFTYVTDLEDLQNFANWFSYYRRRELTAKAAVSRVINSLEGVRLGFYPINRTGNAMYLEPIKLSMPNNIIVDNRDSGFTRSYYWYESNTDTSYDGNHRAAYSSGKWAKWTPEIPSAGSYKVSAWWYCSTRNDQHAKYTISHDGTETTMTKNQRYEYGNVCGQWVELGTYDFAAGTSDYVKVERTSSSNGDRTVADAILFEAQDGEKVNIDKTGDLLGGIYNIYSSNGTPLQNALNAVGTYYDDSSNAYFSAAEGGACQQSFAILMTDGYYNGGHPSVGNVDKDMGAPYADNWDNTLGDIAMKYYNTDLSDLENVVPTNSCDEKETQHMVTYSVAFGLTGNLTPYDADGDGKEDDPCFLNDTTPDPVWPDPGDSEDKDRIDDLWHAAVNGHGEFFSAGNPEELVESLTALFENIASRSASGASVSVNGEELGSETTIYQATYSSDTYTGELYAYPMDPDSGEILKDASDIRWTASGKVGSTDGLQDKDWDTDRKIITSNNGTLVPFRYANISLAQQAYLSTDETTAKNLVNYIRGQEIDGFRPRTKKLGDIVHSAPVLKEDAIYVGANDGMFHAFDKENGREIFAYVPNLVFDKLNKLADKAYSHEFYIDSTAASQAKGKISDTVETMLVCGLGAGGKGYFALDITDVGTFTKDSTESEIAGKIGMWEFPNSTHAADMGYSFSIPTIVKSNYKVDDKPRWVVIFGNGYTSDNGSAELFVLDALTGAVLAKIDTGVTGDNGLSTPAVIDANNDYLADYVYAGDLKGNLWKFDLTGSAPADWKVAFKDGDGNKKPLFQATAQPITSRPDVMWHPTEHGFLVVFGTGKFLHDDDINATTGELSRQHTVYGIWDYGDDADDAEYLGSISDRSTGQLSYPTDGSGDPIYLQKQTVVYTNTINGEYYRVLSNHDVQWRETVSGVEIEPPADPDGGDQKFNPVKQAGWFFDFPNSGDYVGERVIKDITIRNGVAIVLSFIPNDSPCAGGGNSFYYMMNAANGGRFDKPVLDLNGDGKIDDDDLINIGTEDDPIMTSPTGKLNIGMLHAPKFLKVKDDVDKVIMSDSSGDIPVEDIEGETLGMYYWIER